jgi:hypothetical protein
MKHGSIQALFEKIDRYYQRRKALKSPSFTTETIYTLTQSQISEIDNKKLNPEDFMRSHIGQRAGIEFKNVECTGEPLTFDDIRDLAEDLTKSIWDCKDRILNAAKQNNITKDDFWIEVKKNKELCIIADLANSIKHDGLTKLPLSGIKPEINGIRNSATGFEGSTYIRDGNKIIVRHSLINFEIFAAIRNIESPEHELGEVFDLCEKALNQWENVVRNLKLNIE